MKYFILFLTLNLCNLSILISASQEARTSGILEWLFGDSNQQNAQPTSVKPVILKNSPNDFNRRISHVNQSNGNITKAEGNSSKIAHKNQNATIASNISSTDSIRDIQNGKNGSMILTSLKYPKQNSTNSTTFKPPNFENLTKIQKIDETYVISKRSVQDQDQVKVRDGRQFQDDPFHNENAFIQYPKYGRQRFDSLSEADELKIEELRRRGEDRQARQYTTAAPAYPAPAYAPAYPTPATYAPPAGYPAPSTQGYGSTSSKYSPTTAKTTTPSYTSKTTTAKSTTAKTTTAKTTTAKTTTAKTTTAKTTKAPTTSKYPKSKPKHKPKITSEGELDLELEFSEEN